jgi:hypothetical protein
MATSAIFPSASPAAGMYESFYLRTVSPEEPLGAWIRYTVHKRPAAKPRGSLWYTLFDAAAGSPFQQKSTSAELSAPAGGWIAIEGSELGPGHAEGRCGEATWSLRFGSPEAELRHLRPGLLYRAPLPRTKLTTPAPRASFQGTLQSPGRGPIEVRGWPGMVGHNWGAEHAERWIWLHGICFDERPDAWLDVALGRIRLGGRLTPWVANGALSLDGRRHRIGGLAGHRPEVAESVTGCELLLRGERGLEVAARVEVPEGSAAGWRYADPDGGEHDVVNCSVASLALEVRTSAGGARRLLSPHGGAYELGMRERDHGVPIAPFPDG